MKFAVFTCITSSYDHLKQPLVLCPGVDFICFTDQLFMSGGRWQTKLIPSELSSLSKVKQQRMVKICPHRWLPQYDASLWIDGSIQLCGNAADLLKMYDLSKCPLYTRVHLQRHCIYEEANACKILKKDLPEVIDAQMAKYKDEGYPENAGMVESGVILRSHHDAKCKALCNLWAAEVLKYSCRDQLSFNYICWKMHFIPGIMANDFNIQSAMYQSYNSNSSCMFKIFNHTWH